MRVYHYDLYIVFGPHEAAWPLDYFLVQVERRFHTTSNRTTNQPMRIQFWITPPLSSSSWGLSWTGESTVIKLFGISTFDSHAFDGKQKPKVGKEGRAGQHVSEKRPMIAPKWEILATYTPHLKAAFLRFSIGLLASQMMS